MSRKAAGITLLALSQRSWSEVEIPLCPAFRAGRSLRGALCGTETLSQTLRRSTEGSLSKSVAAIKRRVR